MTTLLNNSAATENSAQIDGDPGVISSLTLEVIDEGSWSGTLKVAGRVLGRGSAGASAYAAYVLITDLNSGAETDGDTGITAAGLYRVDIAGLEVRVEHARTAGAVSVHALPLHG